MANADAESVIKQALHLRRHYPKATALEVLDEVMEGRHGAALDFTEDSPHPTALHPTPFGQLIVAAFDRGMEPQDWTGLLGEGSDPRAHDDLLRIHASYVLPRFAARYSLWGSTPQSEEPARTLRLRSV